MKERTLFIIYFAAFAAYALVFLYGKVPWDPCAYMMTGRHFFGESEYYEALRAPVPSLLFGVLGIPGYFLVSIAILALAVWVYARRKSVSPAILAATLLPPLAWKYYLYGGSEILATAFLLLAAACSETVWSAFLFALAFLTRYAYAIFIPFFLPWRKYLKNPRFAATHAIIGVMSVIIWMLVQWKVYGNPIASFVEFYYVNGVVRAPSLKLPDPGKLLEIGSVTLALGLPAMRLTEAALLLVALIFAATPAISRARFYLPILIPLSISSSRRFRDERLARALVFGGVLFAAATLPSVFNQNVPLYERIAASIDPNCAYISNVWVPLECIGVPAVPPPEMESDANNYFSALHAGYRAVGFRWVPYPRFFVDFNQYRAQGIDVNFQDGFFVAGTGCVRPDVAVERRRTLQKELNWFYEDILNR